MFFALIVYPLHLWLVNIAVGSTLLSLWLEVAGQRSSGKRRFSTQVNRQLASTAWMALVLGGLLGVVHGFLIWDDTWGLRIQVFRTRIIFAAIELMTSLILMIAYARWTRATAQPAGWRFVLRWSLPLLAGTNLLYHFPVLFGVIREVELGSFGEGQEISSAEFRQIAFGSAVLVPWAHFGLASLAVSSALATRFSQMICQDRTINPVEATDDLNSGFAKQICKTMATVSATATLLQWIVGGTVLFLMTRTAQFQLTGGDLILTSWLGVSLLMTLVLSVLQIQLVLRPLDRSRVNQVLGWQMAVIFSMSLLRLVTN